MNFSTIRRGATAVIGGIAALALLAGCVSDGASSDSGDVTGTATIGIVISETGPLGALSEPWIDGFKAGIAYETDNTSIVDGTKIELQIVDDGGDATKAIAGGKNLIGQGVRLITGPLSSAVTVALAQLAVENEVFFLGGGSGSTAPLGLSRFVFPSYDMLLPRLAALDQIAGIPVKPGDTIGFIGQDYAFGQDTLARMKSIWEPRGVTIESVMIPPDATDFTPGVLKAQEMDAKFVFTLWTGAGYEGLHNTIVSQGLSSPILTVDPGTAAARPALGALLETDQDVTVALSHTPGSTGNAEDDFLVDYVDDLGRKPEAMSTVGFQAAQIAVQAFRAGGAGLTEDKVLEGLRGYQFESPSGGVEIRAEDHMVFQTLLIGTLTVVDGKYVPSITKVIKGTDVDFPATTESK